MIWYLGLLLFIAAPLCAYVDREPPTLEIARTSVNQAERTIPVSGDEYLEGYIQGMIASRYNEECVGVAICDQCVYLWNLPNNCLVRESIISYVRDMACVSGVCVCESAPSGIPGRHPCCDPGRCRGVWFPQRYLLFQTLVGQPRQVVFGAGWRFHDDAFNHSVAFTSFGDVFPLYRWRNVWPWCGDCEIAIEAAVWSLFEWLDDARTVQDDSTGLVNSDYYVGLPISYAVNNWAFRLRFYHISSHLGDEYIIIQQQQDPNFQRLNPSFEAIDFYASYYFGSCLRLYIGAGYRTGSNESYFLKPGYMEWGFEFRFWGRKCLRDRLILQPYFAVDFLSSEHQEWDLDQNYVLGIECSKLARVGRRVRFYALYHKGHALEGQFDYLLTDYLSLNLSYGY